MSNTTAHELESVHGKKWLCGSLGFSRILQRVIPGGSSTKLAGNRKQATEMSRSGNQRESEQSHLPTLPGELAMNHLDHEPERGPVSKQQSHPIDQSWRRIFSCPFAQMAGKCLDITPYATPGRYRMLSLHNLRLFGDFEIFEFEELPESDVPYIPGYTAVSYVWRGIDANNDLPSSQRANSKGTFVVKGEEKGSSISIAVIMDVAWGALRHSATSGSGPDRFLWLDQFSIIQTSKEDKAWQISRMYSIYRHSRCLILPGGLTRLASLDDTTHWVSRAWTLQEILAAPFILNQDVDTCVLFMNDSHTHEVVKSVSKQEWGDTPYLTDGIIACAPLLPLLDTLIPLRRPIFGFRDEQLDALVGALNKTMDSSKALIWRSAFSRTSSRPVDMIFSIMQCFGVTLNPGDFEKNDRVGATIALVQAILSKPIGRAYWIPALYFLPPAPELSIFPRFPQTTVDGAAVIRLQDGSIKDVIDLLTDQNIVKLDQPAHIAHSFELDGSETMDDQGYYSFVAREVYALRSVLQDVASVEERILHAGDGSQWAVAEDPGRPEIIATNSSTGYEEHLAGTEDIEGDILAVFIGSDGDRCAYMLVKKHGHRKYHRFTHLIANRSLAGWGGLPRSVRLSVGPFPD